MPQKSILASLKWQISCGFLSRKYFFRHHDSPDQFSYFRHSHFLPACHRSISAASLPKWIWGTGLVSIFCALFVLMYLKVPEFVLVSFILYRPQKLGGGSCRNVFPQSAFLRAKKVQIAELFQIYFDF